MTTAEFTALMLLSTAATFTPGPNNTLSTALAANLGLRRSLHFVLAVPVGWGLLLTLCAGGLGALVMALPALRIGIQVVGISYLLWLAFKLAQPGPQQQTSVSQLNITFSQGVMLQFINIKAWMLALTITAGWLAGHPDAVERFAIILPVMLAFGGVSNLTYALIGALLRDWLSGPNNSSLRLRWFNRGMAAMLAATALWMARF